MYNSTLCVCVCVSGQHGVSDMRNVFSGVPRVVCVCVSPCACLYTVTHPALWPLITPFASCWSLASRLVSQWPNRCSSRLRHLRRRLFRLDRPLHVNDTHLFLFLIFLCLKTGINLSVIFTVDRFPITEKSVLFLIPQHIVLFICLQSHCIHCHRTSRSLWDQQVCHMRTG